MATVAEHHSTSINTRLAPHDDECAAKFGALGLQEHSVPARPETRSHTRSTQAPRPYVPPQQQQQSLLDAILSSGQPNPAPTSQQDLLALLQLQQAQAAVTQNSHLHAQLVLQAQAQQALLAAQSRQNMSAAQQQYLQQLSLAAQPRSPLMPQDPALKVGDRLAGARNAKGRIARPEVDARTRFENAPSPRMPGVVTPQLQAVAGFGQPHSPFSKEVAWQSSFSPAIPSPASALRTSESPATNIGQRRRPEGAGLAVLSRRTDGSQSGESQTTSPTSPAFPVSTRLEAPNVIATQGRGQATLGHGRPANVNPSTRAWTSSAVEINAKADVAPRAASFGGTATPRTVVLRQPYGPPGEASELGDRNFQARIRKKAGRGLGLLSRRGDTPASTPILE